MLEERCPSEESPHPVFKRRKSRKLTIMDLNKATSAFSAKNLAEILKTPNVRKRPKLLKKGTLEMRLNPQSNNISQLKPLPQDLNPKIFLQYEELLKQKFIKQMRIYLAERNAKVRGKIVQMSQNRMKKYSGMDPKVLDDVY